MCQLESEGKSGGAEYTVRTASMYRKNEYTPRGISNVSYQGSKSYD